jgi:alkylation response protein AidB-like acyl-CoA dehydrogenase
MDDELLAEVAALCDEHLSTDSSPREFWAAQFDSGLAWPSFPVGRGGTAATSRQQSLVANYLKARRAPTNYPDNPVGVGMVAPVLIALAREDQQARYLKPLFTNDEIWCQLFSEPGAGSDLAGLATQAVVDGDEWIVTGQKVWTTYAHRARWGLLLARTDPDVPKHRGLTCFVVDMESVGVEVRPLKQITGDTEFNEVFLDGVRVPDSARIGDVGTGWKVALATLMNERVTLAERSGSVGGSSLGRAMEQWSNSTTKPHHMRSRLVQLYIESECVRLTKARAAASRRRGTPGPEDSVGKAMSGPLSQRVAEFCVDLAGLNGLLISGYTPEDNSAPGSRREPARRYLRSKANTIEGGTSEILKNIIAERVLQLPPEPRDDKDVAWRDVRRG